MSVPITEPLPISRPSQVSGAASTASEATIASSTSIQRAPSPDTAATADTFASQIGKLFAAVQSGDFAAARLLVPAVEGASWPFYPPARVALMPQSAVDNDVRAFTSAVLSGNIALAQKALTALSVDSAVATPRPVSSTSPQSPIEQGTAPPSE